MDCTFSTIAGSLRQVLRNKRITYAQVAEELGVSEQTIKRVFTGDDAPLSRLLEICRIAGVAFADVARLATEAPAASFELSEEQETFLAENPGHQVFLYRLRDGRTPAQIRAEFALSARGLARYLKDLEQLGVLDRLPGDRIALKVQGVHMFRRGGPLWRKHGAEAVRDMFAFLADAPEPATGRATLWSQSQNRLSQESVAALCAELEEISVRYRRTAQREKAVLPPERLVDAKWIFGVASPYRWEMAQTLPDL